MSAWSPPPVASIPTWQRHVAAYALCEPELPPGPVLDLGCGVGHSYHLLTPRETVGVDIDALALVGQERETVVADMRVLPFADDRFASVSRSSRSSTSRIPSACWRRSCACSTRAGSPSS